MARSTAESAANSVAAFMMDDKSKQAWPKVNKSTVVSGILARLGNPDLIDQQKSPYCGPTSFWRSLVQDDPAAYADAVIALYQTGTCTVGTLKISPGSETRNSTMRWGLEAVDWITLGGLRDSENSVFAAAGWFGDSVAGITVPGTLADWFRKAGYREVGNYAAVTQGTKSAADMWHHAYLAGVYRQKGYRVILFVDADVLDTSTQEDWVSMWPDHWIPLESAIGPAIPYQAKVGVRATVFSWGQTRTLAQNPTKPVSAGGFVNKYYGFVAARL